MKTIRVSLSIVAIVLLGAGYFASAYAALTGEAATYAAKVDSAPVRNLALVLLLFAIASAFLPEKEGIDH